MKLLADIYLASAKETFENFQPEIPYNFCIQIELRIRFDDEDGGHDYSIKVCTPTWLDHNIQNEGIVSGRHMLIVNEFNHIEIGNYINSVLIKSIKLDRVETFRILSRYFFWEYEDYKP